MTDAELDEWKNRGVGGFTCSTSHLFGLGGTQTYTGGPSQPLTGESYQRQQRIRSSRIVPRLHDRGMKIYFSFYVAHYKRPLTPFGDWFDDELWRSTVLPAVDAVAGMAKLEGFDGLAFDQEDYPGQGRKVHSWDWNYAHSRSEADVRAKVRQRGREIMETIVAAYPGVALAAYHWNLPGSWNELVKHKVNKAEPDNAKHKVFIDFFDGLTGVEGYSGFSLLDAVFYKSTHVGASWDTALAYNANNIYANLSRRLHRWDYAASRVRVVPFAWIDHNDKEWPYRAQTAEEVQKQLTAFRRFSVGDEFSNFVYHTPMSKYDYSPYLPAMREAARPGRVDDVAPTLAVADPGPSAGDGQRILRGNAHDNLAVRSVRWSSDRGGAGETAMTMVTKSGDPSAGYDWEMTWEASVPVLPGANTFTVTAEDIKGLTTTATVTIQA